MHFVARFFCIIFTVVIIDMLIEGGYKFHNMGAERFVSASSNPFKFYFALVWQSLIVCISFYFGFMVKLDDSPDKKTPNKLFNRDK